MDDRYINFAELQANEKAGNFNIRSSGGTYPVLILAPHGGKIEPYTGQIAEWIAGKEFAWYVFEGAKDGSNQCLHLTSHHFDEPQALMFLSKADVVLTIHGLKNSVDKFIMIGGLDLKLAQILADSLTHAGFVIREGTPGYKGERTSNICNRGRSGKGVQLEISFALRQLLDKDTDIRQRFISAIREALFCITKFQ